MKSVPLIFVLIASCTALAVPPKDEEAPRRLKARVTDQEAWNPDNESLYQDKDTGDFRELSRVLKGFGPPEAEDPKRYFDWDESCTDAGQRAKIYTAWKNFQVLSESASILLNELQRDLPQPLGATPNTQNARFIFQEDPAYAQMFKARDIGMGQVIGGYDSIKDAVQSAPRDRGTKAALRFICNADDHIKDGNGRGYCDPPLNDPGAGPVQAATLPPQTQTSLNIEQKYRFEYSSSIVFCPEFFDDRRFPLIENLPGGATTLDQLDCAERILLHEYLHLPFTRNMAPSQDKIGWYNAAVAARDLTWNSVKSLPENYAWYALYSWANNNIQGCARDAWPAHTDKPNIEP